MAKKILILIIGAIVILSMLGGTCQPTHIPRSPRPQRSAEAHIFDETTSLVRITNRPSHETSPDVSPCGEFIAFESWELGDYYARDNRFDIWVTGSSGGGGYRRITHSASDDFYPRWYPDGNRIMFTSLRGGYPNIWAKSATGLGGTQRISWMGTFDYSGDISSAGDFIVFSRGDNLIPAPSQISNHFFYPPQPWHRLDEGLRLPRIYRMDINGARVTDLGPGFDPKISPDGKRIAYTSFKAGTYDIWLMDIDGGNTTQITSGPGHEISPCWSPDGKWIAYAESAPYAAAGYSAKAGADYWNIWIVNVKSGERFQKTFNQNVRDLAPAWAYVKEGNIYRDYIFFHSDRDDFLTTGFDIYRIDPDIGIDRYDLPDLRHLPGVVQCPEPALEKPKHKHHHPAKKYREYTVETARIRVLNSTDIKGWAREVAQDLRSRGLNIIDVGNTKHERNLPITKIYYRDGFRMLATDIAIDMMPGKQYIYRWDMPDADIIIALGGQKPVPEKSE
ncbi:MAG TPA: hypothetical protein ENN07_08255 [candidate division Zixibacteria bacterium]|nr:hypothetical protein [candidate division Zixibacteria bacterium]